MSTIKEFGLQHLHEFDEGRLAALFAHQLKKMVDDCHDRPVIGKSRRVSLHLDLSPECDHTGAVETVRIAYQVQTKIPAHGRGNLPVQAKRNGTLVFSAADAENPGQQGLPGMYGEEDTEPNN